VDQVFPDIAGPFPMGKERAAMGYWSETFSFGNNPRTNRRFVRRIRIMTRLSDRNGLTKISDRLGSKAGAENKMKNRFGVFSRDTGGI
jgi:hypothetical protein